MPSAAFIAARRPLRLGNAQWSPLAAAGVIRVLGFLAFIMATRTELRSLVAVLAALSPIPTTIPTRIFLHRRLTRRRTAAVTAADHKGRAGYRRGRLRATIDDPETAHLMAVGTKAAIAREGSSFPLTLTLRETLPFSA